MTFELKKGIEENKILFGIKQNLKSSKSLDRVFVAADCRHDIIFLLEEKNIKIEYLDISKDEASNKFNLDFKCEVFGLRK